jgi:hypothetical protein
VGQSGKAYTELSSYQPEKPDSLNEEPVEDINPDAVPF